MEPRSINGFAFTASITAAGTVVTLVANKDDHEGRRCEVFTLVPEQAADLAELIKGAVATAKARRKAIRKAEKTTEQPQ
jgi:hypothetical protein